MTDINHYMRAKSLPVWLLFFGSMGKKNSVIHFTLHKINLKGYIACLVLFLNMVNYIYTIYSIIIYNIQ